jgi:hypothetical protein
MRKSVAMGLACAMATVVAQACPPDAPREPMVPISLAALQGGWWSDCADPAVEFLINGNRYAGDFLGEHPLVLTGDVLVFADGLVDGHGVDVSRTPLSFRIMATGDGRLVLRPLHAAAHVEDWHLRSCEP